MPVKRRASAAVQLEGQRGEGPTFHRLEREVEKGRETLPHLAVARRQRLGRLLSGGGQARPPLPLGHQIVCRQGLQHPVNAGLGDPQPPRQVGRAQPPARFQNEQVAQPYHRRLRPSQPLCPGLCGHPLSPLQRAAPSG